MRANNMWDVWNILVRTFLNESRFFLGFVFSVLLLPIFQSILGTHEFFGSQKASRCSRLHWLLHGIEKRGQFSIPCLRFFFQFRVSNFLQVFSFFRPRFEMCPKRPTMLSNISIPHGSTRNYEFNLELPPTIDLWVKKIILFCPSKWWDHSRQIFIFLNAIPMTDVQHKIICKSCSWKKEHFFYWYLSKLLKIWKPSGYYYKIHNTRCVLHTYSVIIRILQIKVEAFEPWFNMYLTNSGIFY
jgi:hypothetical protein